VYTFSQLKADLRPILFPAGEAKNLRIAHDKFFVDALTDLQQWVECLQQDNTQIYRQCSTFYNCGLTVLDAPRGFIKALFVIDQDAAGLDDWCSRIDYPQVEPTHIRNYLRRSNGLGYCCSIPQFFALPSSVLKGAYPTPTDVGLPAGLTPLKLGYHYPQANTDRTWGRASAGVWAIERGKIHVAPWIQSTETIVLVWDGLKRTWTDDDPIDDDPLLKDAVYEYVRWQQADKFDKEEADAMRARLAYEGGMSPTGMPVVGLRQKLIRQCREETRVRGRERSLARGSPDTASSAVLFYNESQSATADCAAGTTGASVSATVPAGMIASTISIADANQKASDAALVQARAMLNCQAVVVSIPNTPQSAIANCQGGTGDPVSVTIAAGTYFGATQAEADLAALTAAQQQAAAQLHCTWHNQAQTATAVCSTNNTITVTKTVAAGTHSSTVSQADADNLALTDATNQANVALGPLCNGVFWNAPLRVSYGPLPSTCIGPNGAVLQGTLEVAVNVPAHVKSSAESNAVANSFANALGFNYGAGVYAANRTTRCGLMVVNYPTPP